MMSPLQDMYTVYSIHDFKPGEHFAQTSCAIKLLVKMTLGTQSISPITMRTSTMG